MLFHHGRVSAGRAAVQIAAKLNNFHAVMLRCLVFSELTVVSVLQLYKVHEVQERKKSTVLEVLTNTRT